MTADPEITGLIDDIEAGLAEASRQLDAGMLLDLGDLVPRIERICALAVERQDTASAPRLVGLVAGLDALGAALKRQIDAMATARQPDPGHAAALYRAAQPPAPGRKG